MPVASSLIPQSYLSVAKKHHNQLRESYEVNVMKYTHEYTCTIVLWQQSPTRYYRSHSNVKKQESVGITPNKSSY